MAQSYLDMVQKDKLVEKQKAATGEEKESQQDLDVFLCDEGKLHFLLHFL